MLYTNHTQKDDFGKYLSPKKVNHGMIARKEGVMRYTVRLKEVVLYEFEVEAESCRAAFNIVNADAKQLLPNKSIGIRYEVESITLGGEHEHEERVHIC